jgi:hypothetical protein
MHCKLRERDYSIEKIRLLSSISCVNDVSQWSRITSEETRNYASLI